MFPASTMAAGQFMTTGPLDVCKTPAAPSPIPLPYPNIAMLPQGNSGTFTSKVKISNKAIALKDSEISMSSGDEAGTAGGGVVSNQFKGSAKIKSASGKVKAEGKGVAHLTGQAGMNGNNANVPVGVQTVPSQAKVIVGG